MLAPGVGKRMARLDPLHGSRQVRMLMRPNHERVTNLQMTGGKKRRGHGRGRLANGNDVHGARREHVLHARAQRAIDHTTSAHRIHSSAENVIEIGLELCERKSQWTRCVSDQPERPVTTSNSRSNLATFCSALASAESVSRSAMILRRAVSTF